LIILFARIQDKILNILSETTQYFNIGWTMP